MSVILELMEKLQETHKAITRHEASLAKYPEDKTLVLSMKSLYLRQKDLEKDFSEISDKEHLDICSYRLIAEDCDRFSISALGSALQNFQRMVNIVFDSVENGPKVISRLSPAIIQKSSFDFAYAYPGSLGFVLTMPRERMLHEMFATNMDTAIKAVFKVAKAKNNKDIYTLAEEIGVASIRSVYDWAKSHSQYGMSVDIQWRKKQKIKEELFIETTELRHLSEMIEATSDDENEEINIPNGELVGYDSDLKKFHIKSPEAEDIKGIISDSFNFGHSYKIPDYYLVRLMKKTKIHYAYEKKEVNWELLSLEKK